MSGAASGGPAVASMTAFARRTASLEGAAELAWEVRTVNGKGLDIRLRSPAGFEAEEARFRSAIAAAVARGAVQATLTVARPASAPEVRINAALLQRLVEAVAAAVPPATCRSLAPATLDGLLAVRGVLEVSDSAAPDLAAEGAAAHVLLGDALGDLAVMRRQEGHALRTLLIGQLDTLAGLVDAAEAAPGRAPEAVLERLRRGVAALAEAAPALDPVRLHQEAVLLAMRADVREEIDRLRLHGAAARTLLLAGGPVGRRLDFLAQELAREANTLCAKSGDAGLTAVGLSMRNLVEQFREQVQNLE